MNDGLLPEERLVGHLTALVERVEEIADRLAAIEQVAQTKPEHPAPVGNFLPYAKRPGGSFWSEPPDDL